MNPTPRAACMSLPLLLGLSLAACGPSTIADPQRSTRLPPAAPAPSPDQSALRSVPAAPAAGSTRLPPAAPSPDQSALRDIPAAPAAGSLERVPQPRGGLEDPQPPRPVAPAPRPGALPPGQTTRHGIGPPPPEVIHPARESGGTSREAPTPPAASPPPPRRQIPNR